MKKVLIAGLSLVAGSAISAKADVDHHDLKMTPIDWLTGVPELDIVFWGEEASWVCGEDYEVAVSAQGPDVARGFLPGEEIGPNSLWMSASECVPTMASWFPFNCDPTYNWTLGGGPQYLGTRRLLPSGEYLYSWFRAAPAVWEGSFATIRFCEPGECGLRVVLLSAAVQTTPDTPIVAGDKGCPVDCDGDDVPTIDDFICFQTYFALGNPVADCDNDGMLAIDDFICFQTAYALGC